MIAFGFIPPRSPERVRADEERERSKTPLGPEPIKEQRAAWALGLMTGWFLAGCWVTRSWELLPWALIGLYGLFDVKRANEKLRRP